jgi:hypothetical protein
MEVHLCPPTNSWQTSCSVRPCEDESNHLDDKNQVIVNLDQPVSTVVYLTDHGDVHLTNTAPENSEIILDNNGACGQEQCVKDVTETSQKVQTNLEEGRALQNVLVPYMYLYAFVCFHEIISSIWTISCGQK